jgi:signal transduction histidine kinase
MLRNLTLAAKLLVTILPLIVAVVIITMLDDHYQKEDMISEAQSHAENYARIIRESLVQMMTTYGKVDESYMDRLTALHAIERLHIHFTIKGLALRDSFLTDPGRVERLRRLEQKNANLPAEEKAIFVTGRPIRRQEGNTFHTVIPFLAGPTCEGCHLAPMGKVLGIAELDISLLPIERSIHRNYVRSISISLFFAGIAIIISILTYRKLVSRRLKKLVDATQVIGSGNLDRPIELDGSNDELGELGTAFDGMRTKLKAAREKLIHAERLSIIGQMASSIIHDFRTPMSSINLALESLEHNKGPVSERTRQSYRIIHDSIRQMVTMAQELLDFSRGEVSLHKVDISVDEFSRLLSESVDPSLARSKIALKVHTKYHGTAHFDPDRIYRAIINLVNNSQDAMPKGGKIDIEIGKEDHTLSFRVSDTGTGIPSEIRQTMFDAFVTAGKIKGTGLGLAITKRIIDQHGGTIEVESEHGKGTAFTLRIPTE